MPRQPDIRAALLRPYSKPEAISACIQTDSSLNCRRGTGISARQMQIHGSNDTSQTSPIRRPTEATTVIGSYVTWGGFLMGFPSPATDYVEQRISLDERIITSQRLRTLCGPVQRITGKVSSMVLCWLSTRHCLHVMVHCWFAQIAVSLGLSGIAHTRSLIWRIWKMAGRSFCG